MKIENNDLNSLFCLLIKLVNRKSMFEASHSDINYLKSGLLHLTGQPYSQKSRTAKVNRYIVCTCELPLADLAGNWINSHFSRHFLSPRVGLLNI
jgi:hypothetical protein